MLQAWVLIVIRHPPSCFHRVCIDFGNPEPIYLIVNSILVVKSTFSASLEHHLFRNLKYLWSSMLLGFHSRKHLQKYAVKLICNVFRSELVWLLADFTCHYDLGPSRVSVLLFLIGCGPIPDLQLCPCYLCLKNPLKAGNNRHFLSKY